MNKHVEKAMEYRNATPMINNCAQTILRVYSKEIGIDEDIASNLADNFGGGMKCGGLCGAISAGIMILGTKGLNSPKVVNEFKNAMASKHNGMVNCSELLKHNASLGNAKKPHCDNMIKEAIELVDELVEKYK